MIEARSFNIGRPTDVDYTGKLLIVVENCLYNVNVCCLVISSSGGLCAKSG